MANMFFKGPGFSEKLAKLAVHTRKSQVGVILDIEESHQCLETFWGVSMLG